MAFVEAGLELLRARAVLRLDPERAVRAARGLAPASPRAGKPDEALLSLFALASRNRWFRADCLPRAIALKRVLVRRGYDARLLIGLSRSNPPLGHAWVALGGEVLLDAPSVAETYGFLLREEALDACRFLSPRRVVFGNGGVF